MKVHMRHGATKNSAQWENMGKDNNRWYRKHGQYKSLCWTDKNSVRTSDNLEDVSCKKCLSQYNG